MTPRNHMRQHDPLLTDLYQLTMLKSYFEQGMTGSAVFEMFVRRLPPGRNFLISLGLQQALDYLGALAFGAEELAWLDATGRFDGAFLEQLGELRFTGDVDAMPEGTIFFPNEPILRVTAPLPCAQLVESRLINLLHLQTMIGSKAARCRIAAPGKTLIDFGMRRAHGSEAAALAARAAWAAGFDGTATVSAAREFSIPLSGTMAHAYIQAHASEEQAFENFARAHPDNVVLLIDTYDTLAGASKVVQVAKLLQCGGIEVRAVRLDSGNLADVARKVRTILDEGGCQNVEIFASGDLDEYRLNELVAEGAPIGGFGVGTRMTTSGDAPALDIVYKLQEYEGQARRKRSQGKVTWPGRKQVYRRRDAAGIFNGDIVALDDETVADAEPLIQPVMRDGKCVADPEPVAHIRERIAAQIAALPPQLRSLNSSADSYPVEFSSSLRQLAKEVDDANG